MSVENEENYNPDVPVSRQMTVMCPYSKHGDARRSSMGWTANPHQDPVYYKHFV